MLSMFSILESEKWDEIIKSFKEYNVYYLSGYLKAFQLHGDGEPVLFYYTDQNIRAINVVMKRNISLDKRFNGILKEGSYYDISTPYGYGGFLIEGNIDESSLMKLGDEYSSLCKSEGIISEFVRFHPLLKNCSALKDIYNTSDLGKSVFIDLKSRDHIWANLSSSNRNKIRKSIKNGVKVYWGSDTRLLSDFKKIYEATMINDNATDYYYFKDDFYSSILNDLKYNSLIFYATYNEKIISMSIMLFANNQMHYHLSGSYKEYQKLAPTNLLLFEAACWGSANGYRTLQLGGGVGSKEDSLYKFKSSFNKDSDNIFTVGKKIFDETKYKELVEIRSNEEIFNKDTSFFPAYRI